MMRNLAWLLIVLGVAGIATQAFYLALKIGTPKDFGAALGGGGVMIALGYWLERRTRRKPAITEKSRKDVPSKSDLPERQPPA